MIDVHAGGMGARPEADGVNGIRVHVGNTATQPVELIEQLNPLTIEEWSLVPDSGGAGRTRGGLATRRTYRVEYEEATCSVTSERGRVAPEGLFGGGAGSKFECRVLKADGDSETLPSKGKQVVLQKGDRVLVQPAGSGGYGPPEERPPAEVEADIASGYVSSEAAGSLYRRAGSARAGHAEQ
jgi:N-methylhydantoinase B